VSEICLLSKLNRRYNREDLCTGIIVVGICKRCSFVGINSVCCCGLHLQKPILPSSRLGGPVYGTVSHLIADPDPAIYLSAIQIRYQDQCKRFFSDFMPMDSDLGPCCQWGSRFRRAKTGSIGSGSGTLLNRL